MGFTLCLQTARMTINVDVSDNNSGATESSYYMNLLLEEV